MLGNIFERKYNNNKYVAQQFFNVTCTSTLQSILQLGRIFFYIQKINLKKKSVLFLNLFRLFKCFKTLQLHTHTLYRNFPNILSNNHVPPHP